MVELQIIIDQARMGFCQKLGNGIKNFDFFYSTQIIRYKDSSQYKTLTGGLISLVIIVSTIIGFSNRIKVLFKKTQIYSSFEVTTEIDPPFIDLIPGKDNFIMVFSVLNYVTGQPINLNNGSQLFNIIETRTTFQKAVRKQNIQQQLGEPCAPQHLENMKFSDSVYKQNFKNTYPYLKCLKLNDSYSIGGQLTSQKYTLIKIQLKQCLNTTVNGNKCAPKSQIDSQLSQSNKFQFMVSYINPIINPTSPNHIEYFANTDNRFILSNKFGQMTQLKFSEFSITTDISILSFETYMKEQGILVEERSIIQPYEKSSINTPFVTIGMIKSSKSLQYNRSYLKIQAVISFIGGIVGAFIIVLYIIKFYTDCSLQINISLDLFHKSSLQNQQSRTEERPTFNFYSFVCLCFYDILKKIKKCDGFIQSKRLLQLRKQINYHLNITVLLRRIFIIQQFLMQSLQKDEINILQGKISIQRAVYLRNLLKYTKKGEFESESDKQACSNKANGLFSSKQLVEIEQKDNDREKNNKNYKIMGLEIILNPIRGSNNTEQQNPNSQWELKRQIQGQYQINNHKQPNGLEKKQLKTPTDQFGRQDK